MWDFYAGEGARLLILKRAYPSIASVAVGMPIFLPLCIAHILFLFQQKEEKMLSLGSTARIFVCKDPTDLRKGFETLSAEVKSLAFADLLSGAYFVFMNRQKNLMKVLYWDSDGFAIWSKRLEKGSFGRKNDGSPWVERREFLMILEGVVPKRLSKRYKIS
jgi:transposase